MLILVQANYLSSALAPRYSPLPTPPFTETAPFECFKDQGYVFGRFFQLGRLSIGTGQSGRVEKHSSWLLLPCVLRVRRRKIWK